MVSVGQDWVLWRPADDVAIHIAWSYQELQVLVERKGQTTINQRLPFPVEVKAHYVTVTKHRVMVTAHTDDNYEVSFHVSYYPELGGTIGLHLKGLGFLLDVDLKEGQ
ncbi:MAG: hypothetical protein ABIK73_06965 [candidate division WOR-3 bacterium]